MNYKLFNNTHKIDSSIFNGLQFGMNLFLRIILPYVSMAVSTFIISGIAFFPVTLIASSEDDVSHDNDPHLKTTHSNRLIGENSPYLLQHAHNPVDWYPWGDEAFAKARQEDKPIFLSIGYSTCHWCHVMERESFSNPEIAQLMNKKFISIKVDREERPDVDQVYMRFVQATTGHGGWPLSVWLTPDLKPFVGGTYFPPKPQPGRPDFPTVLNIISQRWEEDRNAVMKASNEIIAQLNTLSEKSSPPENLEFNKLKNAFIAYQGIFDARHGGFGNAPKFPRPASLNFLLRYSRQKNIGEDEAEQVKDMVFFTLRELAKGGINDHLGGGFHRYAVDAKWRVPHFEKMLYNQAQLADTYLNAYQLTGDSWYGDIAKQILHYTQEQLTDTRGGFYSAEDADSLPSHDAEEKVEGAFYVWTKEEFIEILGKENAKLLAFHYGIEEKGNVPPESDIRGELSGKNILYKSHSLSETAKHFELNKLEIENRIEEGRISLLRARDARERPHLDDKIITAWNGLMISSLSHASLILQIPDYLERTVTAAEFIRHNLYRESTGHLLRSFRNGSASVEGFLQDYALLIQGLLDLYEASFDIRWLQWAIRLQEKQNELFWDDTAGGYYTATGDDDSILLRLKDNFDGAIPSPNSIAALNLLRLSQMIDSASIRRRAEQTLEAFSTTFTQSPHAMPQMLSALNFYLDSPKQIILSGRRQSPTTNSMLAEIYRHFIPHKVVLLADGAEGQDFLNQKLEIFNSISLVEGETTAFVCENYICDLPTTELATLTRLLKSSR